MKQQIKLDASEQIRIVYNKIAEWHNGDDTNKTTLINLSTEIVEDMINFSLKEISNSPIKISIEDKNGKSGKQLSEKENEKKEVKKYSFFKKLFN